MTSCSKTSTGGKESSSGAPTRAGQSASPLSPTPSKEVDDVEWMSRVAARLLTEAFQAVGVEAIRAGGRVTVGNEKLVVQVKINKRARQAGQHILAAEFRVAVRGKPVPAFVAGVIGVDATPDGARKTAVWEWAVQYGAPIAFALAARAGAGSSPKTKKGIAAFYSRVEVGGLTLYHGPPGLRGQAKDPTSVSSHKFISQIAKVTRAHLDTAQPFRAATIQLVVDGVLVTGGECRINGAVSPGLMNALKKLSWPKGAPKYMFKLFFVAAVPE